MEEEERLRKEVIEEIVLLGRKLGRAPVKRDCNSLYFRARASFGTWNCALSASGFNIRVNQEPKIPLLSEEFFYFLGLIITDGHLVVDNLKRKNYQAKLYTSFREEKELILKLIFDLLGYRASVRERRTGFTNNLSYEIYISSKKLCTFLLSLGIPSGEKSKSVKVPEVLFGEKEKNILSFVRGVIDGDGSINKNSVKICSGSKDFLAGISILFGDLGISCGGVTREKRGLFNLWVCEHDSLIKLRTGLYKNAQYFYPRKKNSWFNKV